MNTKKISATFSIIDVGGVLFLVKRTKNYTLSILNCKCLTWDKESNF